MNTQPDQVRAPEEDRRAYKIAICSKCNLTYSAPKDRTDTRCNICSGRFENDFAKVFAAGRRD